MSIWAFVAVILLAVMYSIESLDLRPEREAEQEGDDCNVICEIEMDEIGPLKMEDGIIEFKQFLVMLKVCAVFAHTRCLDLKKRLVAERRAALKE